MDLLQEYQQLKLQGITRRHFLKKGSLGLGAIALGSFSACQPTPSSKMLPNAPHPLAFKSSMYRPKAKRIIYLHMAGGPSQLELFDYKPELHKLNGQQCPDSFLEGKRFAFIQGVPKMLGPQAQFSQYGASGAWVSDKVSHFKEVVDEVCFLKAMHTDEFNHAPAQLFMYTGFSRLGRPSMGSWITYGLGSENDNLPGFMVLVSGGKVPSAGKSVWGSGFLPTVYQGVQCRSKGEPVLYTENPDGMDRKVRKRTINAINKLNQQQYEEIGDPETLSRISQYEMAFRMQVAVPEVMDIKDEPEYIHKLYGTEPGATSFTNNCLLARRLIEKGVRYVQLFDWGWDTHGTSPAGDLNDGFEQKCQQTDQAITALLTDLKQRGLLEDTLVVWGGEFGRTPMAENRGGVDLSFAGRDHHPDAFTIWMAGGGIKGGISYGETDEFGYTGIKNRTHIHDLQATILHQLGIDHEDFTFPFQGRDYRLTDLGGKIIQDIIA